MQSLASLSKHRIVLLIISLLVLFVYPILRYSFWVNDLAFPGDFFAYDVMRLFVPCIALSILIFSISTRNAFFVYISLHLLFILIGLSMWYNQFSYMSTGVFIRGITTPDQLSLWLLFPVLTSILLLFFFRPTIVFLEHQLLSNKEN